MDLAVRESYGFTAITVQVCKTHSDHSRLLLIDIDELNQAFLTASLKVPLTCNGTLTSQLA